MLRNVFDGELFSDFIIKMEADGVEFRVHRLILMQSEVSLTLSKHSLLLFWVFRAALTMSGGREASSGEMSVADVSSSAMRALLRFLYTGKVRVLAGDELDVFRAADKYDVAPLRVQETSFL